MGVAKGSSQCCHSQKCLEGAAGESDAGPDKPGFLSSSFSPLGVGNIVIKVLFRTIVEVELQC